MLTYLHVMCASPTPSTGNDWLPALLAHPSAASSWPGSSVGCVSIVFPGMAAAAVGLTVATATSKKTALTKPTRDPGQPNPASQVASVGAGRLHATPAGVNAARLPVLNTL